MSDILQRAIEEAALQMNGDELLSYQKELGECEILVKNLESDKAALTRELEAERDTLRKADALAAALEQGIETLKIAVEAGLDGFSDAEMKEIVSNHRVLNQMRSALAAYRAQQGE